MPFFLATPCKAISIYIIDLKEGVGSGVEEFWWVGREMV